MNYNSRQEIKDLKVRWCNEIENKFQLGETIHFNQPFTVYVTEENTYDDSQVKVPYTIKRMTGGKHLIGSTFYGDEFDDLSIYDLEDMVEVAYILDTINDKSYVKEN